MKKIFEFLLPALLVACYSPDPFEAETTEDTATQQSSKIGTLFHVNGSEQICNPSVSNDMENYPASMLWLNFSGKLDVNAPDSIYTTKRVRQHDRLTVSDTAGNVNWYLMVDKDEGECQFQDPEWSTHGGFIVSLRGYDKSGKTSCDNLDFGIFAVRMADKKKFWFYDKNIQEEATPHLWVDPSAVPDTGAADSTVKGFFGTDKVRLTYVSKDDEIVFVDFAKGGLSKAKKLKKPAGRESWKIDSPLISPDGKFVVYNMKKSGTWEAYIQELSASSNAIKIERTKDMMSEPAQPHWFEFGGRLFVLWTEFTSTEGGYFNTIDLNESSAQDGSVGRTVMREIRLTAGAPKDIFMEWVGGNIELAPIPMIGGRTPDGKFLATGYKYAYLLKLP